MKTSAQAIAEVLLQTVQITNSLAFTEGLNPAQWAALRFVDNAPFGARTVTAFARYHGTTKGTASQSVGALCDKGLVEKIPEPADARSSTLGLTERGRAVLAKDPLRRLVDAVAALPEAQRLAFAHNLEAIMRRLLPPPDDAAGMPAEVDGRAK